MTQDEYAAYGEHIGRDLAVKYLSKCIDFNFTTGKYTEVDFYGTSKRQDKGYVGDIKQYMNPDHPRNSDKFPDYQIDFNKLFHIKKEAINNNLTPLLIVFFTNELVVWDLSNIKWEERWYWKQVNKKGGAYGEKEWELQTKLYLTEATYRKTYVTQNPKNNAEYIK